MRWTRGEGVTWKHRPWPLLVAVGVAGLSCSDEPAASNGSWGPPAAIQVFSGERQRATVLTRLPDPLVVEVLDAEGRPVGGETVSFSTGADGSLSPATAVTNSSGQARTTYTLGPAAGEQVVSAAVADLSPVTFTVIADPGPPRSLQLVSGGDQVGTVGAFLPEPVVVQVVDASGNAVADGDVTFSPETGSAEPRSTKSDTLGRASTHWKLGTRSGGQSLAVTLSGGGLLGVGATARPGLPATVGIVGGREQSGVRGSILPLPVIALVIDAYGNPTPGVSVTFAVTRDGAITPSAAETDSAGRVQTRWTLSSMLGTDTITASATGAGFVKLTAEVTVPLVLLDHAVVDAVLDSAHRRLVTVSADPARLNIVDPSTGATSSSVTLDLVPAALSVQPDGAYAAVGHNGFISYVNLTGPAVEETYAVTADVFDVELPGNGWVYAFPRVDQWETIRSINLSTGAETTTPTIRAGTLVRLHPSLGYIYGANNGLSPSDFEKYDIQGGAAVVLYDSPYHGDYAFSGNVWIYENGDRLIARSGNVFASSSVREQDMLYVGNLPGVTWVTSAAQSSVLQRVVLVGSTDYYSGAGVSHLRSYTDSFLAFKGTLGLPAYLESDGSDAAMYPSEGRFVFVSRSGSHVYVLVRGKAPYEGRFLTGLATFLASDIP